jgi:hypothetical protein
VQLLGRKNIQVTHPPSSMKAFNKCVETISLNAREQLPENLLEAYLGN